MTRLIVGPFNRVEGDLEVRLEVAEGVVRSARVSSPLYRGFERILLGREPLDALAITPRVCGICSVAQSMAAVTALQALAGIEPPPNGLHAANLVLAAENLADHLTHFYLFFMPDLARPVYRDRPWHGSVAARFRAAGGSARPPMLAARARLLHVVGLLAGRWPHTLAFQPGGSTRAVGAAERLRLLEILAEVRAFLEAELFGAPLEAVEALDGVAALRARLAAEGPERCDLLRLLAAAEDLGLDGLGRIRLPLMSYGAYPGTDGPLFPAGLLRDGRPEALDPDAITEDHSHAWLRRGAAPLPPAEGTTEPDPEAPGGYTWCKAPRLAGSPVEVGAIARQALAGHPLALDLVREGTHVLARVLGRLLECARLVPAMERWAQALEPEAPFIAPAPSVPDGRAAGLVEAARGGLGHWIEVAGGRIRNYQIVAPTTWNFSPRDAAGVPGPLEQALVGAPVRPGETDPVAVQHVVRSFDPCMVCTVH
ncbi:nickel-dependent hydrogenase large subunit [Inmirania thermothiophila]|uniref:Hydrogenase large subunit n=1 Tax=Inmirania thermothiophila TaxID=1750597 RepID=A0A3N1Y123_9GAMM|nr:nickel-dependent hydrogenase large subunit [Inmirania thermothiophila]ROR32533.1 hydrogenase large subunit [Inmirania thermothiophila]